MIPRNQMNINSNGVQSEELLKQKEMKLSNRNQTILTGIRLQSNPNILIDFSEINALKKFSEPMEIITYKENEIIKTELKSKDNLLSKDDVEMKNIKEQQINGNKNMQAAIRPTTLNLTGPLIDIFFHLFFIFLLLKRNLLLIRFNNPECAFIND